MSPQPQYSDGGWVTSNRFVYGPDERLLPGHVTVLSVASDLLKHLAVKDAPKDMQRAAVTAWLSANEPDALMRVSLELADLLPTLSEPRFTVTQSPWILDWSPHGSQWLPNVCKV